MSYDIPAYATPGCAYCPSTVRACRQGEGAERGPAFCPSTVDPVGALQLADTYYSRVWGLQKPDKLPSKPARRRRGTEGKS